MSLTHLGGLANLRFSGIATVLEAGTVYESINRAGMNLIIQVRMF